MLLALSLLAGATGLTAAEVNLFGWSEYIPQDVLDGFTKETGIKVNFETYASNEELLSKLVAGGGNYDLIQPSEYAAELMIRRNMLSPLDPKKIPNWKNIGAEFKGLAHDPQDKYTVPYMTGTVGIVVNTEVVKDDIKGYSDVFQPKFKDRLVVLNDNREIVSWALRTQGKSANDVTAANLAAAKPLVAKWVKLVKVFDSDSPKTALLNGDVDIGIVWSGEAALLWKENKKFKYVLPVEGAHRFIDILAIPATAKNKDAAMALINYILKPEVSKIVSENFPYTNPNLEARKLLTPEELANPASYPANAANLETFRDIGKVAADIDAMLTDLKSAQ
jgi:spermidine/putrescine transport system substrate-binding protein